MTGPAIDVGALLTIDVDAEIRKLGRAPLGASEELGAALAARALRAGARRVSVVLNGRTLEVEDDAAGIDAGRLADLAALLDAARPSRERHAALLALEASESTGLLALAAVDGIRRLRVEAGTAGRVLEWAPGAPPALRARAPSDRSRVLVEGPRLARGEVRHRLIEACRFSRAFVAFCGEPLPGGFDGVIGETPLRPPLAGRLAITTAPEREARVWLLLEGTVVAHATLPGLPAFEAAVEMSGLGIGSREPAALREAIEPRRGDLSRQAVALLEALAARPDALGPFEAAALRAHVLRAARRVPEAVALRGLRVLPAFRPGEAHPGLVSLGEVAAAAATGPIAALFPEQSPADYRRPPGLLLVLDAAGRSQLDRLLAVRLVAPPRRSPPTRRHRLRRAAIGLARGALEALRAWGGLRPVPDPELTPGERSLIDALREPLAARLGPREIRLCRGSGPPRATDGALWLPRASRDVRLAVRAIEREGQEFGRVAAHALAERL